MNLLIALGWIGAWNVAEAPWLSRLLAGRIDWPSFAAGVVAWFMLTWLRHRRFRWKRLCFWGAVALLLTWAGIDLIQLARQAAEQTKQMVQSPGQALDTTRAQVDQINQRTRQRERELDAIR